LTSSSGHEPPERDLSESARPTPVSALTAGGAESPATRDPDETDCRQDRTNHQR